MQIEPHLFQSNLHLGMVGLAKNRTKHKVHGKKYKEREDIQQENNIRNKTKQHINKTQKRTKNKEQKQKIEGHTSI